MTVSPLYETTEVFAPPRPVVAEHPRPELRVAWNAFRPQELRELAVLLHERVVLAGGDDPADARELAGPLAVEIRDERRRAVEVAGLVPVTVEELVDVIDAGKADGAADDVGVARGEVRGVVGAEARAIDREVAALGAVEDVRHELVEA